MAIFSQRSHEGCLMVDHRASPGFTEEESIKMGYGRELIGSKVFEAPTKMCNHCGTIVIINPDRKRERAHCFACNMYICDNCEIERLGPDYVHKTVRDQIEHNLSKISKGF